MNSCNHKQKKLFELIVQNDDLVFACGPKGISANLVGKFSIVNKSKEDLLNVGDGTNHVHINWKIVNRFEVGVIDGEGVLTFFDAKDNRLFKLYKMSEAYSDDIKSLEGNLI